MNDRIIIEQHHTNPHRGHDPRSPKQKGFAFKLRRWRMCLRHEGMGWCLSFIFLFFLALTSSSAYAQKTKGKSKKQLQSEITTLQKEISNANQLLKKTTKDKEMTLNEVSILENKIKQREQLIKACNEQIAILDEEINIGQTTSRASTPTSASCKRNTPR